MKLLETKKLSKSFNKKEILKNINITIPNGKIIGLLGKNGAGKTTLIKLINDLLTPTSGEIARGGSTRASRRRAARAGACPASCRLAGPPWRRGCRSSRGIRT